MRANEGSIGVNEVTMGVALAGIGAKGATVIAVVPGVGAFLGTSEHVSSFFEACAFAELLPFFRDLIPPLSLPVGPPSKLHQPARAVNRATCASLSVCFRRLIAARATSRNLSLRKTFPLPTGDSSVDQVNGATAPSTADP